LSELSQLRLDLTAICVPSPQQRAGCANFQDLWWRCHPGHDRNIDQLLL